MKIMGMSNIYQDPKEQLAYIYNSYIGTRPGQSNIFVESNLRSYRDDMHTNAEDIGRQMEAIKTSLGLILTKYRYTNTTVYIKHDDLNNMFLIDVETTNSDGLEIKLSDSLILDNKI